jgi:tetratricopeptide (TPR) repeat protein
LPYDIAYYLGGYMEAQRHFDQVRDIAVQLGGRRSQSIAVTNLGIIARDLGAYRQAKELLTQGLTLAGEIGFRRGEAWALVCLSLLLHLEQKESAALAFGQQGLRLFSNLSDDAGQAYAWTEMAHALVGLEQWEDGKAAYHQALTLRRALSQPHLEMEVLAGLIRVDLARQDLSGAKHKAQTLFTYLAANRPLGTEEPVHMYWTCYLALDEEQYARKMLNDAQRLLGEHAAAIEDDSLRHSFLQGIVVHRRVREAWTSPAGKEDD